MLHSSSLRSAAVLAAAGLLLAGCGLDDVGPDLDAWQAAQADSQADAAAGEDADAVGPDGGDTVAQDTAAQDAADADAGTESDAETTGDVALPECTTATTCDDGDPCSADTCDATGTCQHGPVDCDDGNGCTVDSCTVAAGGCEHVPTTEPCDDGTPCTAGDKCAGGKCIGVPLQLDVAVPVEEIQGVFTGAAALADGGAILAGFRPGDDQPGAAWAVRIGASGAVIAQWTDSAPPFDWFDDVAVLPGGDLLFVGKRGANTGGPNLKRWIVRLSADLQSKSLDLELGPGELVAVRGLADGGWLIGGEPYVDGKSQAYLARFSPKGEVVWQTVVESTATYLTVKDVERIGSGFGLVGGEGGKGWLRRFDQDGTPLSEHTYDNGGGKVASFEAATQTPDGGLLLVGSAVGASNSSEIWMVRTDAAGKAAWNLLEQAGGENSAEAVTWLNDGRILLGGYRHGPAGVPQAAVWQIDGNGGVAWTGLLAPAGVVTDLVPGPNGGIWLSGVGGPTKADLTARAWRTDDWGHPTCEPTSLCAGKVAADCADTDVCTHDVCDPQTGCKHPQNQAPCDDGKPCTAGEACQGGACQGGAPTDCDDVNSCTADSCDPGQGCLHVEVAPGTACVDGDACTTFDTCEAKACKGQAFLPCDDGNPCSQDGCDAKTGCTHANLADYAACGGGQLCLAGQCKAPWATAVSVGSTFACALRFDNTVACWGGNQYGELGAASLPASATPVQVTGVIGTSELEVGAIHGCAFSPFTGDVTCWGSNGFGQIGGVSTDVATAEPAVVPLPSGVTAIAVGGAHACALEGTGAVRCWGYNGFGQVDTKGGLGGNADKITTPALVPGLGAALLVEAGTNTSCAITAADQVLRCWGAGAGIWSGAGGKQVAAVKGLPAVTAVAVGESHACAVDTTGAVWCWGSAGEKLGHGTPGSGDVAPAKVAWTQQAKAVAVGSEHSCALTVQGGVWCWGAHDSGQLGIGGSLPAKALPGDTGLTGIVALAARGLTTCAVRVDGSVQCWGTGPVGTGAASSNVPVPVVGSQLP